MERSTGKWVLRIDININHYPIFNIYHTITICENPLWCLTHATVAYPGFQRGGCLRSGPIRKVGGGGGGGGCSPLQVRYEKWIEGSHRDVTVAILTERTIYKTVAILKENYGNARVTMITYHFENPLHVIVNN